MTEEQKKIVAIFRFGVISDLVTSSSLKYGEQERLIQEKCARQWDIPYSFKTSISRGAIFDWVRKYKKSGNKLESLYPKKRKDAGKSRTIDDETAASILEIKKAKPDITLEALIKETVDNTPGLLDRDLPNSNVYRLLKSQNMTSKTPRMPKDRRKFEAENPNDMWQSDVMHGPKLEHNNKLRKTYLLAIIDDHSRLIPNACFCFSENLATYLKFLEKAFRRRGLPRKLYVDNGAAFKSNHLKYVAASLEIALINTQAYDAAAKGKIERWFKTVRSSFLPTFSGTTIVEINKKLTHWVNDVYHHKKHTSTGEKPIERFAANMECIRVAPSNLTDYFRKTVRRKVAKDRTVTINGKIFEAPVSLIGKHVELLYHDETPEEVEVKYEQKSYGFISPVDVHVNCRVKRHRWRQDEIQLSNDINDYKGGELFGGSYE